MNEDLDTENLQKLLSSIDDLTELASKRADISEDIVGDIPETVTDNLETLRSDLEEIDNTLASVRGDIRYALQELREFEETDPRSEEEED